MFDTLKEIVIKIIKSRLFVLWVVLIVLFAILAQRLFVMQIINGENYLTKYTTSIEKQITIEGTRGNIYDSKGVLLAYNKLSYTVTIQDSGTYDSDKIKNASLNSEINNLIEYVQKNNDSILNDCDLKMDKKGNLTFSVTGTALQRFRADVYGVSSTKELGYSTKLGYSTATATASQIYSYLSDKFGIDANKWGTYRAYQIMVVRYALSLNSYQKYVATDVAEDVSDKTVAVVEEHADELTGVSVENDTKRVYNYPEYFSSILGYTGQVSTEELASLQKTDKSYTSSDIVGKSGIEQIMETQLQGTKGTETVYVNNLGKIQKVKSYKAPTSGNNVYLSIDAKLQIAVYDMIEQELSGIIYDKIVNAKKVGTTSDASDIKIPVYTVYNNLISNNVISLSDMETAKAGTNQASVYKIFKSNKSSVSNKLKKALSSDTPYNDLSEEMQESVKYAVTMLQNNSVFDKTAVDSSDKTYKAWKNGTISAKKYLEHAIEQKWIQISNIDMSENYADTDEVYSYLIDYVENEISDDTSFDKIVYKYLIMNDSISARKLCLILYEQGVLKKDSAYTSLKNGTMSSYSFVKSKVKKMQLTPAQLALDPCTGSAVLMDPNTGQLLACVSYPGYNNNKLANTMDSSYYTDLLTDKSLPLYNNATQQTTAPGSTFKMVSAITGLSEGVISPGGLIDCLNKFTKLGLDIKDWSYPSAQGKINVSKAIAVSCDYYFNEVGYRLSMTSSNNYSEAKGVAALTKYAKEFGLGSKTGIEIPESTSQIANELPIAAAMGQSNSTFTTVELGRYVAALANQGTVYNLTLLDKVTTAKGKTVKSYKPKVRNTITNISSTTWSAVKKGMIDVVKGHTEFDDITKLKLAGKTGTAQEDKTRPNHALFVGYAPYDDPVISIATRIAYGYSSTNACDLTDQIMKYYFASDKEKKKLLKKVAANVGNSANAFND